jgi:hypothetical protein
MSHAVSRTVKGEGSVFTTILICAIACVMELHSFGIGNRHYSDYSDSIQVKKDDRENKKVDIYLP